MNRNIISLTLRLVVGLNFLLASAAHFHLAKFYVEDTDKITSWITHQTFIGNGIAVILLIVGLLLISGLKTIEATLAGIVMILLNHICLLSIPPYQDPFNGPLYNSFYHSVPFIGFLLLLYYSSTENKFSLDSLFKLNMQTRVNSKDLIFLTSRIFVGSIFITQGLNIFLGTGGFIDFAKNVYVDGYSTTVIPVFLLWIMGILNPFILATGGFLLTIGLKTKWAAYILAFFLVSISFGHLLGDPFKTSGDISMYGFNNLAFILVILLLENGNNKYCADRLTDK